jgi:hypothetical protein
MFRGGGTVKTARHLAGRAGYRGQARPGLTEFIAHAGKPGYYGRVMYEMCEKLRGGGSMANLDRCARKFLLRPAATAG